MKTRWIALLTLALWHSLYLPPLWAACYVRATETRAKKDTPVSVPVLITGTLRQPRTVTVDVTFSTKYLHFEDLSNAQGVCRWSYPFPLNGGRIRMVCTDIQAGADFGADNWVRLFDIQFTPVKATHARGTQLKLRLSPGDTDGCLALQSDVIVLPKEEDSWTD